MFGNPIDVQKSEANKKVSDFCQVISGYPFASELFNESQSGRPLIRIRDVARGYTETYTTESSNDNYIIRKGDLLIGMDGMFDISPWQSEDALLNQRVCMVKPKTADITKAFVRYSVRPVLKDIEGITMGTTVKHLSASQVSNIRLPFFTKEQALQFEAIEKQADKSKFELKNSIAAIDKVIKSLINENL